MDLLFILLFLVGGIVLIVLEIVAIPGSTIAGLSGIGMLVYGIYRVFIEYGNTWGIITLFLALSFCTFLLIYSLRAKTWKRFALNKSIDSKANDIQIEEFKVGDKGITITRLAYAGMAEINGKRIEVFTSTSFVDPKTEIEIERIEGSKILVRPI
ncbi:MAG: nodulation efficiency protein D (NfeD) [Bacteroidales bacterium]|nr:nodulation efficiency protein D (NfeD) [Bacteroidales bacterium]